MRYFIFVIGLAAFTIANTVSPAVAQVRTWITAEGKNLGNAEYVGKDNGEYKFRRTDGSLFRVPIGDLPVSAQQSIANLEKKQAAQLLAEKKKRTEDREIAKASAALGVRSGEEISISYSYEYHGLITHGTSKFVFNTKPVGISPDGAKVQLQLTRIKRYWNDEIKESNIRSMPFTDPRGYKVYNSPPTWGDKTRVGDAVWVSIKTLKEGQDKPGQIADTGKGDKVAVAVAGTAIVGAVILKSGDSTAAKSTANEKSAKDGSVPNATAYVQNCDYKDIAGGKCEAKANIKFSRSGTVTVRAGFQRGGKFYESFLATFYSDRTIRGDAGDTVTVTLEFPEPGNLIGGNKLVCVVIE